MSVYVPLLDSVRAKPSNVASLISEIQGERLDLKAFVQNFDVLTEAPGSITRFRKFILNLAVRGGLLGRSPSAESSSTLLSRVAAARAKHLADGSLRQARTGEAIEAKEPFALPEGWSWASIGNTFDVVGGIQKTPQRAPTRRHYPYLRVENVQRGALNLERIERFELEEDELERWHLVKGDLLVVEGNGSATEIGRCAIWDGSIDPCVHQNHIIRCRAIGPMNAEFVLLFLNSPAGMAEMKDLAITTSGLYSLSVGKVRGILVPVPPLAEQKRIVAKVDQLIALCDELEARQTRKREVGTRLTKSALGALTTAEGREEFDTAWTRVAENFEVLIDRAQPIGDLRGCILGLAVCGRLGSGAEGIQLPAGWVWETVGTVTELVTDGEHLTPQRVARGVPLATAKNVRDGYMDFAKTDFVDVATAEKCWGRCKPQVGDLLMVCVGATTGRLCVLRDPVQFVLVRSVALLRLDNERMLPDFLAAVLRSPDGQRQIWASVKEQAQPCLYLNRMKLLRVPCPPVHEQKRIVAMIQQLMRVCDDLEAKMRRAEDRAAKLVEAVVGELVL